MVGAEVRRYASDRRGLALNIFLGIAGGGFGSLAETLVLPSIVLAYFVGVPADSLVPVGLVPAIGIGLWSLARLPALVLTAPQRRKLPWAIGASLIRAAAMALLAVVCFRAGEGAEEPLIRSFFICYVAYSLAAGFASVPTAAVLAKAIPHEGRGVFFRQRALWGGAAGIAAGLVVAQLLRDEQLDYPENFALLFLAATVCQLATAFFVATLREPVRIAEGRGSAPLAALRALPEAIGDVRFRRFLFFRGALSLAALLDPFLIIFAASRLGAPAGAVGGYVVAFVAGRLLAAPLWAGLAARQGEKAALQVAALLRLVPPLLALLLPYLAGSDLYRDRIGGREPLAAVFGIAFVALGASMAGQARGNFGYLAEAAPARLRGAYAGLTNAMLAVLAFAPVFGGLIADARGYETLFLAGGTIGLVAVFASGGLTETFVRTSRTAGAWSRPRTVATGRRR